MHNNSSEALHYKELLESNIEHKFGRQVKYTKDCRLLSEQVHQATGRQLSVSTVKRFFGLIHSPFNPSKYTLDTFSKYLGMENWERFIDVRKSEAPGRSDITNGDLLKKSFKSITKISCISLSRKARYNPDTFIHRTFAEAFFEGFIKSGKTGTMLIAPAGYGKSALLLQWMNSYFTGKDRRFRNDVVSLIDGVIFFTFYSQAHENELLTQLLDFDFKTIHKLYERQKTNPQKVRYFLIIDDVDQVFSVREKYYQFAENIMRLIMLYKENPLLKVILSCRPENLDTFIGLVKSNPLLADAFYGINLLQKNQYDSINVPLFTNEEIKHALGKNKSYLGYYHVSLNYPDLLKIINTPHFLSFFVHDDISSLEEFAEIDFMNRLIQHFYCSHPFAEEKQQLIKKFLQLSSINENDTFVNKDLLLEKIECRLAYQELIKAGLLHEYLDSSNQPGVQLNVSFSSNEIFEYLLAWSLVREEGLNLTLINQIFKKYQHIIHLQYSLLRWIVKIAFFEGNTSFLKQLHQSLESQVDILKDFGKEHIPGALRTIQTTFLECFRTNSKFSEILLTQFAKTRLGQRSFFEEYFDFDNLMNFPESSLLSFVQVNNTTDGRMIYHFVRFVRGFYLLDLETCSSEFESISRINYDELNSSLCLGYYFSSWFLYASLTKYQKREAMLKKFLATSENLQLKSFSSRRFHPGFEFFVVYHLNTSDFFEEGRFVAEYLIDQKHISNDKSSGFYQYFQLCYARSLFHTGEQNQALEIYRQIDFPDFPFQMKHFMQINFNLARYDFLEFQNKTAEALNLLQETRTLANDMGYIYFVRKAEELEIELLKANNDLSS